MLKRLASLKKSRALHRDNGKENFRNWPIHAALLRLKGIRV